MLLFGIIPYLFENYPLKKLTIEAGNQKRLEKRLEKNETLKDKKYKIQIVPIKQHKYKWITYILNTLGFGKYKKSFKFFGGGEALTDERPFWHDGRNIPVLFNTNIIKGEFVLLWGIGKPSTTRSKLLYKILLPRAKEIITREKISYDIVKEKYKTKNLKLYEDFSLEVLRKLKKNEPKNSDKYILVNINTATSTSDNIQKIECFCKTYPEHKRIFFSCDMNDDIHCFKTLQAVVPWLDIYDRTKYSLQQTIELFSGAEAGIGSRLHFLLPLKFFAKKFQSLCQAEKVQKMINI